MLFILFANNFLNKEKKEKIFPIILLILNKNSNLDKSNNKKFFYYVYFLIIKNLNKLIFSLELKYDSEEDVLYFVIRIQLINTYPDFFKKLMRESNG